MKMVDVSMKFETIRTAQAEGKIYLSKDTIEMIKNQQIPKGDVLTASKMAGMIGAKKTPEILPFCHPILIDQAFVETRLDEDGVYVRSYVRCIGRTGVEMEALSAVSAALLNIYDMCKAFDKNMVISDIKLISKSGGKSDYEEDLSGLNCAVITLSDSCYKKEAEDKSGKVAIDIIENEFKGKVVEYAVLPDDYQMIVDKLKSLVDKVDIVFTTGGTGFSKRDVTPEATKQVIEKQMIGFEEAMRVIGVKFTPKSLLSRGVCGIAGEHTLIINLPGSSSGVRDNLRMIAPLLKHAIRMAKGEKNIRDTAILVFALMWNKIYEDRLASAVSILESIYGNTILQTDVFTLDYSSYYKREMGEDLLKKFVALDCIIHKSKSVEIKRKSIRN